MSRQVIYLVCSFLLFILSQAVYSKVEVAFTPGDAEKSIINLVNSAQKTIDIAAYSFTSNSIAQVLLKAAQRNVKIRVVADEKANVSRYTVLKFLSHPNIILRTIRRYAIMHNKFMIVDGNTVETGSFNYTKAAASVNAENIIIITQEPQVTQQYLSEFTRLWNQGESYIKEF